MASSTRTVNVKFDGDAKGLQRAAKDGEREVDRFSKSVDKKFKKSGDESGKGFAAGLKKWFSPSALGEIGKDGGTVFGSGFLGAIKTPVLGPAILGVLAGAVAIAAPAAGAIAASGLVLAFGAGLAGLGITFAAKSKVVQDKWKKTLDGMGKDMTLLSKPFEDTLISIADFAQRTFDKFKPSLEAVFKEMAPAVTEFADQVSQGLEKLQPAIRPIAEAFDAVLRSLGPAIQGAIGNVSDGLIKLAESVKKNPDGLADLVDGLGDLSRNALGLISVLNDANGKIKDLTGGTSAVDIVFGKANSKIGWFIKQVKDAVDPLGKVVDLVGALGDKSTKTTGAVGLTGDAVKLYTQGLDENQVKSILAGKSADGLGPKIEALAVKYDRQWRATQKANEELFRNSGLLLTLSGSEIGYQQALDDATASQKENGRTLDINTTKGRANKTALDNLASSANVQTEAMRNANDGNVAAATHAEGARQAFVKQATQMGMNKKDAEKLAASLIAIPNVTRTAKLQANKKDLEDKLAAANTALKDPNLTKARTAALKVDKRNAEDGLAEVNRLLNGLPKSKTITIKYTTSGVNLTSPSSVGRRASGGVTSPKRRYLYGERGPEIAEFGGTGTGGPKILSAEQTRRELSQPEGGDTIVYVTIDGQQLQGRIDRTVRDNNRQLKRTVKAA